MSLSIIYFCGLGAHAEVTHAGFFPVCKEPERDLACGDQLKDLLRYCLTSSFVSLFGLHLCKIDLLHLCTSMNLGQMVFSEATAEGKAMLKA